MKHLNEPDYQRTAIVIFLVAIILLAWQMFVQMPRRQHIEKAYAERMQEKEKAKEQKAAEITAKESEQEYNQNLTRAERLALAGSRVSIKSDKLHGSISLKGARFDDLTLAKYKVDLDKNSPEVTLLSPNGDKEAFFAQAGWVATDGKTKVPDGKSVWAADKPSLAAGDSTVLRWENGEGVTFFLTISLDSNYMFSIKQRVENRSANEIKIAPYGYVNRAYIDPVHPDYIVHQGAIGVMDGTIFEMNYQVLRESGNKSYDSGDGWLGITDKYWFTALIPDSAKYKVNYSHYKKNEQDRYQADYVGETQTVSSGLSQENSLRLFAGAKEVDALDMYAAGDAQNNMKPILLFDRAVDFGLLYFITKPLLWLLNFLYAHIGNFGLAIMAITVLVKASMFSLYNKSYKATAKMRVLQPDIMKLRERYVDDPMTFQKETMALYKRHGVNPASGCLPILPSIPVFFALFKVLNVAIEMRHAPFFGWLKDLSAPDSSNIFTAFGLFPWDSPAFLHLGILPILYCITMVIQQYQNPPPTDPVQAKMLKIMPFLFMFIFASFPAGLVLYWVWSGVLSIIQQEIITLRHGTHRSQRDKADKKAT